MMIDDDLMTIGILMDIYIGLHETFCLSLGLMDDYDITFKTDEAWGQGSVEALFLVDA